MSGLIRFRLAAAAAVLSFAVAEPTVVSAAPVTFIDQSTWLAATAGFATRPGLGVSGAVFHDALGAYTDPADAVWVSLYSGVPPVPGGPGSALHQRTVFFSGPRLSAPLLVDEQSLAAQFGCYSPVWPCLGMIVLDLQFAEPIHGFSGQLEYRFGNPEYRNPANPPIPLLADAYRNPTNPISAYVGFFGVLFPEPVTSLRIAWREPDGLDDVSIVRLTDLSAVTLVPEPASLALLAAALVGLAAAARGRSVAMPALPLRGRWPT